MSDVPSATSKTFRPRRSVLYMPGANARALEKAKTLPADALILDLEDAVAPDMKATARDQVAAAVIAGGYGAREVVIRTNAPDTQWWDADLAAVVAANPDAILVPKVSSADDIASITTDARSAGISDGTALWVMIETPLTILNIASIAAMAREEDNLLTCFVLGTNDLAKDTGASLAASRFAMVPWLTQTVAAAHAYGLDVIDGVYNNFKDVEGLEAECRQGALMGMDGKTLIHPGQIETANRMFSPDVETVDWSRKIIAAFDQPENANHGVITVDGKMVELLHAEIARKTVAIADAIDALATTA